MVAQYDLRGSRIYSEGIVSKQPKVELNGAVPTEEDLDKAFGGIPVELGNGFIGTIEDEENEISYLVWTAGDCWHYVTGIHATEPAARKKARLAKKEEAKKAEAKKVEAEKAAAKEAEAKKAD